jgi:hypothetical protein
MSGARKVLQILSVPFRYNLHMKLHQLVELTSLIRVLLEKLIVQAIKKFPTFYGTEGITVFPRARHWTVSRGRRMYFIFKDSNSSRFTLILSSHLRLGLPSGLFPSGLHTESLCEILISPTHTTYLYHLILLDLIVLIFGEEYKWWSPSL